jgi:hypothetical protein
MLENEKMMDLFLKEIIPAFCNNISSADEPVLVAAFEERMKELYGEIFKEAAGISNLRTEEVVALFADQEIRYWQNLSIEGKRMLLIKDQHFEELLSISLWVFEMACVKIEAGIENESHEATYDELLGKLQSSFGKVQSYNLIRAKHVFSEALQDLDYLFERTNKMSLRLGRVN